MARLSRRFLSFLTFIMALTAAPSSAQTPAGRITGVVRNPDGNPVAAATVTVINRATGLTRTTTTGDGGVFTISGLAPGGYSVHASLFGGRGASERETVRVGTSPVSVDLVLDPLRLEALTVTAMLREQQLADVPFSIAAPTAQVLRSRGAVDMEGIAVNVAGFNYQNLGPGQNQVAIRGASAGQIARDQPGVKEQVGVYLDNLPISLSLFTPDLDLFDMQRVEVLRGPQGTLFGAGSLAGTVRYISNQPEVGLSSVFGEAGGSLIDGGGPGGNAKVGFNLPVGQSAAFRAAGYYNRLGGYMDSFEPNSAQRPWTAITKEENINTGDKLGVRAALRMVPSERFSILPQLLYQHVKMDGWNRIDGFNILANPYTTTRPKVDLTGDERELFTQIPEPFTDDFILGGLTLAWDFGTTSLTSVTSYNHRDVLVVRDAGALTSSITGGSLGLSPAVYTLDAPLADSTTSKVWTQEVRLAGNTERVRWLLGGFYSGNKRDYSQILLVQGFEARSGISTKGLRAPKDVLFFSDLSYDLKQYAIFGEATFHAADRLDLTAGLRYYNFDEDRDQVFDGIFGNDDNGTKLVSVPGSTSADGIAPRFIASFKASSDVTLNAQAARGVRLGGINDPLNVPLCTPADLQTFSGRNSWQNETTWNYELGLRSRLMGGRGSLNVSAFYLDISDLQLIVTAGSCSSRLVFNVPHSRSPGLEMEFTATPDEHWDISLSGTVTNPELRSTLTSTDADGQVSVVAGIEKGNQLPSVAKVQGSVALGYRWEVTQGSLASITGTFQYVGKHFTQIDDHAAGFGAVNLNSFGANTIGGPLTQSTFRFDPELPAYNFLNLRLALTRQNWEVSVFGSNLTDERALLALDRERGTLARVGYLTNSPRTVSVTLRFNR